MILYRLGERAENDSLLSQSLLESGFYRDRIEHGIHRHSAQGIALVQRNTQLVKGFHQLRINLLALFGRLWGSKIDDVLKVDGRDGQMAPGGHLHSLPLAKGIQAELQHPGGLFFALGDGAHDILIQPFREELLLDIGSEPL